MKLKNFIEKYKELKKISEEILKLLNVHFVDTNGEFDFNGFSVHDNYIVIYWDQRFMGEYIGDQFSVPIEVIESESWVEWTKGEIERDKREKKEREAQEQEEIRKREIENLKRLEKKYGKISKEYLEAGCIEEAVEVNIQKAYEESR